MGNFNPKLPGKYQGTDKYITFFVTRNRAPTSADYRQPETGTLYSVGTVWQVGKDPTSGTEGDLWMLSKIVANVAYWVQISSGVIPSAGVLTLSDTANTLVYPTVLAPVGNIQLEGTAGQIDITADPINNKLVFSLPGGGGAVDSFAVPHGTSPVVPTAGGLITLTESTGLIITGGLNTINFALDGAVVGQTITGQSGGALSPTAGNWNIYGATVAAGTSPLVTAGAGSTLTINAQRTQAIAATDATKVGLAVFDSAYFTVDANGYVTLTAGNTDLHWPKFIVGDTANGANYSTLAAAYAAASAGDVIGIQSNLTITEDLVVEKNIYITGLGGNGYNLYITPSSKIVGKLTINAAHLCVSNLEFRTNSDVSFLMNNASATVVANQCYFNGTNANTVTGFSAQNNFFAIDCSGFWASTYTFGAFNQTVVSLWNCNFAGTGTLAATDTKTTFYARNCAFGIPFTASPGGYQFEYCTFGTVFTPYTNQTWCTYSGGSGGGHFLQCSIYSGSSSCLSIGAGCIVHAANNTVNSSNVNVFTGAGTIYTGGNVCTGSSTGNNVATINNLTTI